MFTIAVVIGVEYMILEYFVLFIYKLNLLCGNAWKVLYLSRNFGDFADKI